MSNRTNNDQRKAADAWLSWELLRRGVCCNDIPPMEQEDIVEACGFPNHQALSFRVSNAIRKGSELANDV